MSEKLTLLQRINAVQREVDYVQKEKKQGMRYSIVSHDAVTAKVRPLMVKHGVVYYPVEMHMDQVGNRTQSQMVVRFVSVDDAADFMDVVTAGYGIDDQDKGPGKAISYSVKYALLKALGLESGDDPDQDQDVVHRNDAPPPPAKRQVGWSKDGTTRTANSLRKEGWWQEFESDLKACEDIASLAKVALHWSSHAEREKWPGEWKALAKDEINSYREAMLQVERIGAG